MEIQKKCNSFFHFYEGLVNFQLISAIAGPCFIRGFDRFSLTFKTGWDILFLN